MYAIFIGKNKEFRAAINMDSVKSFNIHPLDHKTLCFHYTHDNDYFNLIFDTEKCLERGIKSLYEWMNAGEKVVYICLNDQCNTNND